MKWSEKYVFFFVVVGFLIYGEKSGLVWFIVVKMMVSSVAKNVCDLGQS